MMKEVLMILVLIWMGSNVNCGFWKYNPISYGNCMVKPCKTHCNWMRLISVCMRSVYEGPLFKLECKRLSWFMRLKIGQNKMEELEQSMMDEWWGH